MKQFIATVFIGSFLAIATALVVLLYWLMMLIFGTLHLLTLPFHFIWRRVRVAS